MPTSTELKLANLTEKLIGVFYNVYNELGYGSLESVYEASLVTALRQVDLTIKRQVPVPVWVRWQRIGEFMGDIMVGRKVFIEVKSARALDPAHEAQLLHYPKATEIEIGLLLNFGERPQFRRLLFDNERKKIRGNPCKSVAGVAA